MTRFQGSILIIQLTCIGVQLFAVVILLARLAK